MFKNATKNVIKDPSTGVESLYLILQQIDLGDAYAYLAVKMGELSLPGAKLPQATVYNMGKLEVLVRDKSSVEYIVRDLKFQDLAQAHPSDLMNIKLQEKD